MGARAPPPDFQLNEPEDDVAVALAGPARGPQTVENGCLDVGEALATPTLHGRQRRALGERRRDGGGRESDAVMSRFVVQYRIFASSFDEAADRAAGIALERDGPVLDILADQ